MYISTYIQCMYSHVVNFPAVSYLGNNKSRVNTCLNIIIGLNLLFVRKEQLSDHNYNKIMDERSESTR